MSDDATNAEGNRWDAFTAALPTSWLPMAVAFQKAFGIVEGEHQPDGSWCIDLTFGLCDLNVLLRAAPADFAAVKSGQDWWLDQHLENEGGILVARDARAIIEWSDHFSAGLNATLHVFTSEERYEAALSEARERHADNYDDEEQEQHEEDEGHEAA